MPNVTMYTDGACTGNPGPGGYGAIIEDEGGGVREVLGGEKRTTNNRMELMAVIRGLESLEPAISVRIISDSQYVVKGMTQWIHGWKRKGWKTASGGAVKNRDLWVRLSELVGQRQVEWEWVRGHAGHPGNERADALARQAIEDGLEE